MHITQRNTNSKAIRKREKSMKKIRKRRRSYLEKIGGNQTRARARASELLREGKQEKI